MRDLCATRFDTATLRRLEGRGLDRQLWKELARLGIFDLQLEAERGGAGLGPAEAVLVFEALGQSLVPGPLVWSHLAAGRVEGVGDGEVVAAGEDALGPRVGARAPVEHATAADGLLRLDAEGVRWYPRSALRIRELPAPLDPLTPVAQVEWLGTGEQLGGAGEARTLRQLGAALDAGFLLGSAQALLELSLAHARERQQFDRPIGSFQSLKHLMADMFARQELARGAVYTAAAQLGSRPPPPALEEPGDGAPHAAFSQQTATADRAVSSARVVAAQAAERNARACIQIHGGLGYTWEMPAHYHLKRCWVLETRFGDRAEHADRLAAGLLEDPE